MDRGTCSCSTGTHEFSLPTLESACARQQKYSSTNDVGLGNRLLRKNILVGSVLPTFKVLQEELEKGTCCWWWCWCCRCWLVENAFHYSRRDGPLGVAKKKDARIQIVRAIVHAKPSTAKGKEREDTDAAAPQHKIVGILIPPGKEHSTLSAVSRACTQ